MAWIEHTVSTIKSIALVAHDNRKDDLIQWCNRHYNHLVGHSLYATGTTGKKLEEAGRSTRTACYKNA